MHLLLWTLDEASHNKRKGPVDKQQSQRQLLFLQVGVLHEDQTTQLYLCAEGLGLSHACCLFGGSVSVGPYGPRLVDL